MADGGDFVTLIPGSKYNIINTIIHIILIIIIISELRMLDLDDCRQSSAYTHVHHLRNEQCTCAYDLKQDGYQMVCKCKFDQVLDQTIK